MQHGSVRKWTILVCEDEALIAMDLQDELERNAWTVIGPFRTSADAMPHVNDALAAAVIDPHLADGRCDALLAKLQEARVPTVIYSGGVVADWPRYECFIRQISKPGSVSHISEVLAEHQLKDDPSTT